MSDNAKPITAQAPISIGMENEAIVQKGNDKRVLDAYSAAVKSGEAKKTPMKDFEITALKAEMKQGGSYGDRSVDMGGGKSLFQFKNKVYIQDGAAFCKIEGFKFPALPMASLRF